MRMALPHYLSILLAFNSVLAFSQGETIGLLHINNDVSEGYTLMSPSVNSNVYLIDNCGEKVHEWVFNENPGLTCYLLDNGNLLRAGRDSLQIRDWNNNVVWTYAMDANGLPQHHDIEPLPNGNILALVRNNITNLQAIAAGRDPAFVGNQLRMERIVELQPIGMDSAAIVWEWDMMDHLVQDFDMSQANYGSVVNSPELFDFNYNNGQNTNWVHANAVEYNATLDHIMISSRGLSEVFIIDHSTTTAEAAGHTGGNSGKGGDILWRWGNPEVYRQGTPADRKLYFQHDPKWVRSGYPDDGKISLFNNDADSVGAFSSVGILEPNFQNNAYTMTNGRFDPVDFDWTWSGSILGVTVDQNSRSGAQVQANGNITFCETQIGRISEVDKQGNHTWTYVNPTGPDGIPFLQGSLMDTIANLVFRAEKYPSNHPAFSGLTLMPSGILENTNSISMACLISTSVAEMQSPSIALVNPTTEGRLVFTEHIQAERVELFSTTGAELRNYSRFNGRELSTGLPTGFYIVRIMTEHGSDTFRIRMM